jgi:hypothetical protein
MHLLPIVGAFASTRWLVAVTALVGGPRDVRGTLVAPVGRIERNNLLGGAGPWSQAWRCQTLGTPVVRLCYWSMRGFAVCGVAALNDVGANVLL